MPDYCLYLFGAPRLEFQDRPVEIDTRKALALLAYVLIENQPQNRDTLAALLWPESNQTSARAALRRTLSPLRSVLSTDIVDFGRELIAIHPGKELWCDVIDFQAQLAECCNHGHPETQVCPRCLEPLQKAAALYRDDFMAGFSLRDSAAFDDWQFFETDRLKRIFAGVLERLVTIYQESGEWAEAIEHARRWLSLDALNEAAHRALIELYAASGQRNAALRQYRKCVRVLDDELGVPPLQATTQLYEAVKENRFEVLVIREHVQMIQDPLISQSGQRIDQRQFTTLESAPLIGRDSQLALLKRLYHDIHEDGVFIAVTGEEGIGKTHLVQEFIAHLQDHGVKARSARCYPGESSLTFAPLIDLLRQGISQSEGDQWWEGLHTRWLGETASLVPELSAYIRTELPSRSVDGPGAQIRFYEGVCRVLIALVSGSLPGVLFVDNLEWTDESTLDLLAYLIRRLKRRPLCLVVAWRERAKVTNARLQSILVDAIQQGYGYHLKLEALTSYQIQELVEYFEPDDRTFPLGFKERLVKESEGLPYYLVEYLQAARSGGIAVEDIAEPWPVPVGLREMFDARIAALSGAAVQILQAAAIISHTVDSELLQSVSGRTEDEIIQGLEELLSCNLIREIPPLKQSPQIGPVFDFKHDIVRALVLEDVSLVRTRLLHRRTAETLVEQARYDPGRSIDGQIAYHYQQAGFLGQAAEWYYQAGHAARRMHANTDAFAHFQAALSLGFPNKLDILIELGDLFALQGDYDQAVQQYETAAAINDPKILPLIEQKIGQVNMRLGHWERAICHFEAALFDLSEFSEDSKNAFEAKVRADWSLAYHRNHQNDKATELAQESLELALEAQDILALAQVHNILAILARAERQVGLAIEHLSESLSLSQKLGNPVVQIAALNNLALAQADQQDYQQAVETIQRALDACLILGDRHLEAAVRNNYADLLRASGNSETAMSQLKQAVSIFADIGRTSDEWEPEIWKLAAW